MFEATARADARPARLRRGILLGVAVVAFGIGAGACRPHVRLGDIEPAEGQRVLVDAHVRPTDPAHAGKRVVGALVDPIMADAAFAKVPVIGVSTIVEELGSNLQSADTPATDAPVEPSDLGVDARRIESIYAARGYFRARTLTWTTKDLDATRTRVEFEVVEGEPTVVSALDFTGITAPADDAEAAAELARLEAELPDLTPLRVGAVWTERDYLEGLANIRRAFRSAGFIHAEVRGDTFVSRDMPKAAVRYVLTHGPLVRAAGPPKVNGNAIVPTARILRRAEFEEGTILTAEAMRDAEQRIFELGQFLFVQLRPVRGATTPAGTPRRPKVVIDGQPDRGGEPAGGANALPGGIGQIRAPLQVVTALPRAAPVEIEVQEAPEWDFNAGFGARTDNTLLSLEAPVGFNHRDLFGELVNLRTEARPALVFPQAFADGDADVRVGMNARVVLSVPSFFEEYLKFNISTAYRRDVTQGAGVQEVSGAIDWSRRFGSHLSARVGWNISYIDFFDRGIFDVLTPDVARDALALRFLRTDRTAWLGASLVYDSRDGIFAATKGLFASLSFDLGETWLGSAAPFERLVFEGRAYLTHPDFDLVTLGFRVRAGAVFGRESFGTNESQRLRSGGQSTNRGFGSNRMGDYLCINTDDPAQAISGGCSSAILDRLYVGGNWLLEANAEIRLNFGTLGLVGFVDVGNVWNRLDDVDLSQLYVAVGPGLRLETPIGPFRADLGIRLGDERHTEFHVGLGQAF